MEPSPSQIDAELWSSCGIHTILNAWVIAMGLEPALNVDRKLRDDDYTRCVAVINMALKGQADFWLIYFFLKDVRYIKDVLDDSGIAIEVPTIASLRDGDTGRDMRILTHGGARYFDQTICMKGTLVSKDKNSSAKVFDRYKTKQETIWNVNKVPPTLDPSPPVSSSSHMDLPQPPAATAGPPPTHVADLGRRNTTESSGIRRNERVCRQAAGNSSNSDYYREHLRC